MLFRVLGPLSVKGAGPALSALMVRRLLAALLCRPNECVALENLVLALWGEKAPPTARRTLQVYIRRLRGALAEPRILHEPAGYRIVVKPGELDGRLPLALRLAGARLRHRPDWTPAQLAARLRDRRRLLGELRAEDRAVAATFALSYDQLTPDQQLAFRALGHHPGVVYDAHHVAAMLDITPEFGDELLNGLVEANLLVPTPSGYRMHDLLRAYAMAQNEPDGALHRLLDWYLHMADLFNTLIGQPYPRLTVTVQHPPRTAPAVNDGSALACLEFEHANLLPVIGESLTAGHPLHTWQLTCLLWRFWYRRGDPDVWVSASSKALEAARQLKDEQAEGTVLHFYGLAELQAGRPSQAIERLSEALALREHDGDPALVGHSLNVLGICHNNQAQYRQAKQYNVRSLQLARSMTIKHSLAWCSSTSAWPTSCPATTSRLSSPTPRAWRLPAPGEIATGRAYAWPTWVRHMDASADTLKPTTAWQRCWRSAARLAIESRKLLGATALALSWSLKAATQMAGLNKNMPWSWRAGGGESRNISAILNDLGSTLLAIGERDRARACYQEALQIATSVNNAHLQAKALAGLGATYSAPELETARRYWTEALEIFTELGLPEALEVRSALKSSTNAVPRSSHATN